MPRRGGGGTGQARARQALETLLTRGAGADERQRPNASLATLQAAVAAVLAQL